MTIDTERLLGMYRDMLRIRAFETKISDASIPAGVLNGNYHTCIGQEAVAVGVCAALGKQDFLTSTHRGHGHCIARGANVRKMMAELLGKEAGYCHGRGGSLHVADVELGIMGANGIVGGGIPLATGSALASQIMGKAEITAAFFGDGASNEGTFHESLNLAAAWRLPVVYVCENNEYGCKTQINEVINTHGILERAAGYGIPGWSTDGNDVADVYETMRKAAAFTRQGNGPSMIECHTFRRMPHNSSEPETRPQELMDFWSSETKDALLRTHRRLLDAGIEARVLDELRAGAQEEMEQAFAFAMECRYPDPGCVTDNVYAMDNERCVAR